MAIYHLTAKVVSRGKGDSSVAAAAYQSRSRMVDERTGEVHNYSRNAGDVLFEGIYAPKDAPAWSRDRASLWNHVEAFERRKDAQLARSFDIALPHELTVEQNRYAVQDWVRDNFTRKGWIADVAVHAPGAEGDDRNIHAHVLVVMRKLDGAELAAKKERAATVADRKSELEALRESWERIGNRHLERHGFEPTLDRRSFEDRGIEQLPTVHLGKDVSALERDGVTTDRGDLNREIVAENERRVIDLAAARTMRDAQTAAQGRTDDTRPEPQQPMQEAAQRPEQPAAEIETRGAAAEPSIAAHQSASTVSREAESAATAEPEQEIMRSVGGIGRQILDAVTKPVANFIMALADIFSAPPLQTKQQVHDRAQAEGNIETRYAQDYEAAQQERDARLQEMLDQIRRQDAERDLSFSQRYGRPPTREANPRERDDDYERERER
jgi:ATP-dependent exoDNAse (exonuclease V) alpha subunit